MSFNDLYRAQTGGSGAGGAPRRDLPEDLDPFAPAAAARSSRATGDLAPFQHISSALFRITASIAALQRQLEWVGTSSDTVHTRKSIHTLVEQTRGMVQEVTEQVRACPAPAPAPTAPGHLPTPAERAYKLAYQKMHKDYKDTSARFLAISQLATQKLRDVLLPAATLTFIERATTHNDHDGHGRGGGEEEPLLGPQHDLQVQVQLPEPELEYNEALIQERDRDLANIETSLLEVNQIFRDLGTIVHEQQYVIDNIEEHVSNVGVHMEGATEQLRQADKRQRWRRSTMCWILGALLAVFGVVLLLVLLLKPRPAGYTPAAPPSPAALPSASAAV